MGVIKNRRELETSEARSLILDVIEAGLTAIHPEKVLAESIKISGKTLQIKEESFNLSPFKRIFIIGIGKGSAQNSLILEQMLGEHLTAGWVIDTDENPGFAKVSYTKGTHPLPSEINRRFAENLISGLGQLAETDLVLFVVCGGGSAMLFLPNENISTAKYIDITKALLKSGADIEEVNTIRKHISQVKGGGMAKLLSPATTIGLIFSDVLGDDLATIASGPLTLDDKSVEDAKKVAQKYNLELSIDDFTETVKEAKYFKQVKNILILNNMILLEEMKRKAEEKGIPATIYSNTLKGEASEVALKLLGLAESGKLVLAGGETTVDVKGEGKGGRNQHLVLSALPHIIDGTIIASVNSDGWDNTEFAGAIGDTHTSQKAQELGLNISDYLKNSDSYTFFQKTGDGVETGRLPSNVSDVMLIYKPK